MRFLIDAALAPAVAEELRHAGYDAIHVRDYALHRADDALVMARARTEGRVLVSCDTDFGTLLALSTETQPSVVLFRRAGDRRPVRQAALLVEILPTITDALHQGSIVVIEETRLRVRPLPIAAKP